jgi:hypothetical protein
MAKKQRQEPFRAACASSMPLYPKRFPRRITLESQPVSIAALLPTSNGKLYVGGSLLSYNGVNNVGSLVRLNMDGTLDSTFVANVGYLIGTNVVETIVPAGDGTRDIYVGGRIGGHNGVLLASGGIIGSTRVQETGALDSYRAPSQMSTSAIAPVQDGTVMYMSLGLRSRRIEHASYA